jgi:phosphopantetheinyl transferase
MRPESIELVYGERGKPALARCFADSGLRFNVSHCNDVAVYAFSSGREIGIDVEAVRLMRDADDIAARFFSPREYEAYLALDPRDRPLGFFNCWTRKEAFIKALGDGLYHPLDRFDVSLAPEAPARILRVESTAGDRCGWCMESFSPVPGFVAAIVTERAPITDEPLTLQAGKSSPDLCNTGSLGLQQKLAADCSKLRTAYHSARKADVPVVDMLSHGEPADALRKHKCTLQA